MNKKRDEDPEWSDNDVSVHKCKFEKEQKEAKDDEGGEEPVYWREKAHIGIEDQTRGENVLGTLEP